MTRRERALLLVGSVAFSAGVWLSARWLFGDVGAFVASVVLMLPLLIDAARGVRGEWREYRALRRRYWQRLREVRAYMDSREDAMPEPIVSVDVEYVADGLSNLWQRTGTNHWMLRRIVGGPLLPPSDDCVLPWGKLSQRVGPMRVASPEEVEPS